MVGLRSGAVAGFLHLLAAPVNARFLRTQGEAATRHPVTSVIETLKKLGATVEEEGQAEELTYEKFQHWCGRTSKSLKDAISDENSQLEELADLIASKVLSIDVLAKKIDGLQGDLDDLAKADTKNNDLRSKASDVYDDEKASLEGTIKAVQDCLTELDATPTMLQSAKVGKVLAMAGPFVSAADRTHLESFLQAPEGGERPDLKASGDHEGHKDVYKKKSFGIIEMLKDLETKFQDKLRKRNQEETNAVNAHSLQKSGLADSTKAASDSKTAKETAKGEAEKDQTTAESEQSSLQGDLKADTQSLGSTEKMCDQRATEWAERSKVREGEKEAIAQAIEVLAKVAGVRTEAPENPVPPASPVFFLQLDHFNPELKQAVQLLRQEAKVTHSQAMEQLAAAVAALRPQSPFDQVVNQIEKMIFHLQNEQREEDDHKNWCDKELEKTNTSLNDKDDKIDELTGKIDVMKSRVGDLTSEISAADKMVAKIAGHMKEAAEIRKTGKEQNALAVKDAEAAQQAITAAIAVLTDFYKGSGQIPKEAWEALLQQRAPIEVKPEPVTWDDGKYAGVANPLGNPETGSEGIITLLKDVSADFARMESDALAQEETDENAFEEDVKDCKIEKARRAKESEVKDQEKKRTIEKQTSMEKTRKGVTEEREATNQYLLDLQPACVEGDSTYEDRKEARSKEIEALGKAKVHLRDAFDDVNDGKLSKETRETK